MLDSAWVERADFDLFHLHFGFDAVGPEHLEELCAALRRRGRPFVLTVHDLRNPHHDAPAAHDRQLDVLIPAADALVTLTPGAAATVSERWGRDCEVVPHPHVVDLPTMARLRRERLLVRARQDGGTAPFRVGIHLKSLRPNMAPLAVLPTLVETVADLPHSVLQVNVHCDVMQAGTARHDPRVRDLLLREEAAGHLELHVHDFLSDDDLWQLLAGLDVSVLPYRFGTHSGWLEACRDLGTTVVAPSCGHYAEQGTVLGYTCDEDEYRPDELTDCLRRAHADRVDLGADVEERRTQRHAVARAHDDLYRRLLA